MHGQVGGKAEEEARERRIINRVREEKIIHGQRVQIGCGYKISSNSQSSSGCASRQSINIASGCQECRTGRGPLVHPSVGRDLHKILTAPVESEKARLPLLLSR